MSWVKIFKFLINLIEILIKEFLTLISPVIEGRMLYKVRFRDTSTDKTQTTYTYDTKLPEILRKEFHIKYTYSGKARKRSLHKPAITQ